MAKFRKKPVVIDAIRAEDAFPGGEDWPAWIKDAVDQGKLVHVTGAISINTFEGTMLAYPEDWIVRGVYGELYPVKPDIFDLTYEPVK